MQLLCYTRWTYKNGWFTFKLRICVPRKQTVRYALVAIIKYAYVVKTLMLYIEDGFSWGLCKFLKGFVGIFSRLKVVWIFDFNFEFLK